MALKEKLTALRDQGWTDEEISVSIGKFVGGTGPSSRSVFRWRSGRGKPHRVYQRAVDALLRQESNRDKKSKNKHQNI